MLLCNSFWRGTACTGIGLAVSAPAMGNGTTDGSWGHHGMMWNGGGMGWFMGPIMMLLFIAAAAAIVVLIVRALGGHGTPRDTQQVGRDHSALRILEERFARGEIDAEEFRQRKRALEE
jgi:putative membrane protein